MRRYDAKDVRLSLNGQTIVGFDLGVARGDASAMALFERVAGTVTMVRDERDDYEFEFAAAKPWDQCIDDMCDRLDIKAPRTIEPEFSRLRPATADEVASAILDSRAVDLVFPAVSFVDVTPAEDIVITFDVEKPPAKDQIIDMVPERPLLPPKS